MPWEAVWLVNGAGQRAAEDLLGRRRRQHHGGAAVPRVRGRGDGGPPDVRDAAGQGTPVGGDAGPDPAGARGQGPARAPGRLSPGGTAQPARGGPRPRPALLSFFLAGQDTFCFLVSTFLDRSARSPP